MRKGDKLKVVGVDTELGAVIVERELDDGAVERSAMVRPDRAEEIDLPEETDLVSADRSAPNEFVVTKVERYRGPSRTSTPAFRNGWDKAFGNPKKDLEVN